MEGDRPTRRPEFAELETFLAAARTGSVVQAGAQLGISKTAAAKRLASLEALVGDRLLDRSPRGVTLTEAGRQVLPEVEQLLSEADQIFERLGKLRRGEDPLRVSGLRALVGDRARSTEQVLADTQLLFAEVFHRVDQGIVIGRLDDGVIVEVNDAFCRMLERDRDDIVGSARGAWSVESPAGSAGFLEQLRESGAVAEYEAEFTLRSGIRKHVAAAAHVIKVAGQSLVVSTIRDITRRERLQARLMDLYSLVVRPSGGIGRAATTHELYEHMCETAVQEGGFALAWVGELNAETGVVEVAAASGATGYLSGVRLTVSPDDREAQGPTGRALRELRAVTCSDIATDPTMLPWRERARAHGLVASAAFPLVGSRGARAVLSVYSTEAALLTEESRLRFEDMAVEAGITLDATQREAERFRQALAGSELTAFMMDRDLRYTWMENPSLGYAPEQVLGRTDAELLPPEAAATVSALKKRVLGGESVDEEVAIVRDGRVGWFWLTAQPIRDASDAIIGLAGQTTDITKRKEFELRLQHLADHDPLTGVYNSRRMLEELDRQLRYARRSHRPGAVLVLDLDHFKLVNDSFGHSTGDGILKTVADVVRNRVRLTDVVARLGGDEFAVLLPEASGEDALVLASSVRDLLRGYELGPPITTSIGIAVFTGEDQLTGDEILVCADTALYEAKEYGGDQARVYSGKATGALTWVARIQAAITQDRLVLHAQPIIDLRTGRVTHRELLVRMLGDDGEIIPPGQFIATAERFRLICELDRWVTNAGLRLALAGERVTINLSGQSIGEQPIINAVEAAIADDLNPANVMFEITETAALRNITAAPTFAATLAGLGCAVALDDFGTGFGSFTYLKHIPARYLKIDMEFVHDLTTSETDQEVVKAIVGIARSLNKLTIAEGVENAETLELLRALGVDQAQGFFIGRPEPITPPAATDR